MERKGDQLPPLGMWLMPVVRIHNGRGGTAALIVESLPARLSPIGGVDRFISTSVIVVLPFTR